ncbi:DUF3180 domain-containing protein [Janibacter limosus]|uniref:DUF3180 domain-containing protein n=1 Tax=Janibacter limosus TaxID=53458 RepID=A0AC61U2I5_9MICO|nr:DUF3180 domain-containing protein [Janibacter limosus]UUZ44218.1 DUF3180 domain-containing protein [Janibacter limosus]
MLERGLRSSTVAIVLVAVGVLSWAGGRWWVAGGHAPMRVGWLAGVLLLGMGLVVVATGRRMWRMRRGRGHVEPLVAARIPGLAPGQRTHHGAVIAGLDLGQALALLPDVGFAGRGELAVKWAVGALGAPALVAAGLLVQSWCRLDDDDDEDPTSSSRLS